MCSSTASRLLLHGYCTGSFTITSKDVLSFGPPRSALAVERERSSGRCNYAGPLRDPSRVCPVQSERFLLLSRNSHVGYCCSIFCYHTSTQFWLELAAQARRKVNRRSKSWWCSAIKPTHNVFGALVSLVQSRCYGSYFFSVTLVGSVLIYYHNCM